MSLMFAIGQLVQHWMCRGMPIAPSRTSETIRLTSGW
jgi:hypothetical protein